MVRSRAVAAVATTARVRRRGTALAASVAAALASCGSAWAIVDRRLVLAGAFVAVAGVGLVAGAVLAHGGKLLRERTLDSFVDRLFDGAVLGSIVWVERTQRPGAAAAALVALAASFLGSYVRARGNSLDYRVEESMVTRGIRYGLLVAALGLELEPWTLWVLASFVLLAALVRASQVAKEERA
jgi:CDP-diacylglycerol--glycerol-3-phosphate 3-phosphatidyltransferase